MCAGQRDREARAVWAILEALAVRRVGVGPRCCLLPHCSVSWFQASMRRGKGGESFAISWPSLTCSARCPCVRRVCGLGGPFCCCAGARVVLGSHGELEWGKETDAQLLVTFLLHASPWEAPLPVLWGRVCAQHPRRWPRSLAQLLPDLPVLKAPSVPRNPPGCMEWQHCVGDSRHLPHLVRVGPPAAALAPQSPRHVLTMFHKSSHPRWHPQHST